MNIARIAWIIECMIALYLNSHANQGLADRRHFHSF